MTSRTRVEVRPVAEQARLSALPRHFGRYTLIVEHCIYDFMAEFARGYTGGYWRMFELSNGGFYMSPPEDTYELRIDSNGFRGRMSADAAGITVCLFAFSHLSFDYATEIFPRHFHHLRELALDHPEARVIFEAID